MSRIWIPTFAVLVLFAGCAQPDRALKVTISLKSAGNTRLVADCVKLSVLDGTTELKSLLVARAGKESITIAVRRGTDLPATVKLQASGYLGKCDDDSTLKLNALGDPTTGAFPESGVTTIELTLEPPSSALDSDRDGYVAVDKGGLDCRDDDATIFPGGQQVCSSTIDTDCDGFKGCDDSDCGTAMVCANPPDRLTISGPRTMQRYECVGPFTVQLRNTIGPRVAVRDTAVALTSSLSGTSLHATANCTDTAITTLPITFGNGTTELYLKADATAFGVTTINASSTVVGMAGSTTVEVHPVPVDHVGFLTTARTVRAGECGAEAVTLELRDAMNRHTDADTPTTLQFTSAPGDLNNANIFFSDASCGTATLSAMLMPGEGTTTFYVLARRAGTFTLTASPSVGTAGTQSLTVTPSVPTHLAFTNAPLALLTTTPCSTSPMVVQLQDAFDNAATLGTDLPVHFTVSGLQNVTLHPGADTTCTAAAATDFTIPAGVSQLDVRPKSMTAGASSGQVRVAPANGATIAAAQQRLDVGAGPASRFTWEGQAQSPVAGFCSVSPFTLKLLDATGNPTSSSMPMTFTLSTAPGSTDPSFGFFSGAGCVTNLGTAITIPAGQTSTTLYFRGNKAVTSFELVAMQGSLTGPVMPATGNSILPSVPAKLVFGAPASQTITAGTCTAQPYVARVVDQYDNSTSFTSAQTVNVTSNPSGVTVGTSGTCDVATSVPLAAGASQVSFIARHTSVQTYQVSASVGGFSTNPTVSLQVTPGLPTVLQVDTPPGASASVVAGACQDVVVTLKDAFGNPSPVTAPVTVTFPPSTTWQLFPRAACGAPAGAVTVNNNSTVTFSVSPRTSGNHQVGLNISGLMANLRLNVTPAAPTLIFETPNTGTGTATATQTTGGCTPVTVARKDMYGNDVPLGAAGSLTFGLPTGTTAHTGTPCTVGGNDVASISLMATEARASFWVRATRSASGGGPVVQSIVPTLASQTATLSLTVNPGAPILSITPVGPANVTPDQCVALTVERRDSFGNLVPLPGAVNLTLTAQGGAIFEGFDSANCMGAPTTLFSVGAGASTRSFSVRSRKTGNQTFTAGLDGQNVNFTLSVSSGPTTQLIVEGLPSTVTAGQCSGPLVVRRRDAWNNDVTSGALSVNVTSGRFSFSSASGTCANPVGMMTTVTIPDASALSTDPLYAVATLANSTPVSVVATSTAPAATGNAPSLVNPGASHHLSYLTSPGSVVAGQCSSGIQVELRDAFENQIVPGAGAPYTLTLSSTNSVAFFSGTGCSGALPASLTNAAPVGTFSFRPTLVAASESVTASGTGPFNVSQTWSVTAAPASKLAWKADPTVALTRFTCVSAGVLRITDAYDNATTVGSALTVTPTATGNGAVTFFSDASCASPITTLTVPMSQGEGPEIFMFATGADGPATISATATAFTAAPNRVSTVGGALGKLNIASTGSLIEAGGCLALTVERVDSADVPVGTGTTTLTISVPVVTPQNVTLYTASDCLTGAGTSINRTISTGASTATFYARGRSAAAVAGVPPDVTITASDVGGSTNGTYIVKPLPLVRRGSCDLTNTNDNVHCALSPAIPGNDISRSFLVFTSTGTPAANPSDQNVECHLDATGAVEVVCTRVGTAQGVSINYQVVSFGRDAASGQGITVQHYPAVPALTAATPITLTTAVNTAKTFLLTSNTLAGAQNDNDGFPLVRFSTTGASVGTVDIVSTGTPTARSVSVQVVTVGLTSAAVTHHAQTTPAGTNNFSIATSSTPVAQSFALSQALVPTNTTNANYICKRRFNTKLQASTVSMRRAAGGTPGNCVNDAVSLAYVQRVTTPAIAVFSAGDVSMATNVTTTSTAAFTAVTTHKSITFLMSQGPGGQTSGESNLQDNGNSGDDTGPFHALLDFNAGGTQVNLTRTIPANNTSVFTPMVVQFDP